MRTHDSDGGTKKVSIRTKLLISASLIGGAAAFASLGTFGLWTSTTSASQPVTSGTVTIALGAPGSATNRLTIGAVNVLPGDTIQRQAQLSNTGSAALASISLTNTAVPSSLLDTDAVNGLQMTVQSCAAAWVEAGVAPAYTYTCGGGSTMVLASRAVIGAAMALPGLNSLAIGGVDHLLFTLSLPLSAPTTMEGLTSTINFSFLGTQTAGTNK